MAITITGFPSPITPAYNTIQYTFTSTNSSNIGFRYIVDVYSGNTTTNRLTRQKVIPQLDKSGKVDISRILSNYVSVDFVKFLITESPAENSFFNYSIRVGEEYVPNPIPFSGTSSGGPGITTFKSTPSNTNTYVIGDQIIISSTATSLNGFFTVVAPTTTTQVSIKVPWDGITHSGNTKYADGRKVIFSGLQAVTGQTIFSGAYSFNDFLGYASNIVNVGTPNVIRQFLTDLPVDNFYATPLQQMWFNVMLTTAFPYQYHLYAVSDDGQSGATQTIGPNGLREVSQYPFSLTDTNFNLTNVKWIEIFLVRENFGVIEQLTKKYRIWVDNRCTINNYEIAFQDRLGSIGSFAFQLRDKKTGTIERVQYKQTVHYPYDTTDRGTTNIWIGVETQLELNTNWMTEEMALYFEQLLTSPYTWIQNGDGNYSSCVILDSTFETEFQRNKRLIRKTITVQMANNDSINV